MTGTANGTARAAVVTANGNPTALRVLSLPRDGLA